MQLRTSPDVEITSSIERAGICECAHVLGDRCPGRIVPRSYHPNGQAVGRDLRLRPLEGLRDVLRRSLRLSFWAARGPAAGNDIAGRKSNLSDAGDANLATERSDRGCSYDL